MRRHPAVLAFALDAGLLVLFAALGRRTHDEGSPVAGTLVVAAPFLAGWAIAAVAARLIAAPLSPRRATLAWAIALPVGFALRAATGRGLAFGFIVVALLFTAATLVGWRAGLAASRTGRASGWRWPCRRGTRR
jgi:hypothetical protein